jgi:hypothetical protein
VILWADAALNPWTGDGGVAVVREDGTVEFRLRIAGPLRNVTALEKEALRQAIRVAESLVEDGQGLVQVRTDCRQALRGHGVKRRYGNRIRLSWASSDGNLAHSAAREAAGLHPV